MALRRIDRTPVIHQGIMMATLYLEQDSQVGRTAGRTMMPTGDGEGKASDREGTGGGGEDPRASVGGDSDGRDDQKE